MKTNQIKDDGQGISISKLLRWSGLAAMVAGLIYIAIQPLHPEDVISSVTTSSWMNVHILSIVMDFLAILGLTGLYAKQSHKAGRMGFAGYMLLSIFFTLSFALHFLEAFISPALAKVSPSFVEGLLGLVSGHRNEVYLGSIPTLLNIAGIAYVLGGILFGIATFRANVLPRWSGFLLAAGAALTLFSKTIPHPANRILAVPVGLAIAWMGYAVFSKSNKVNKG